MDQKDGSRDEMRKMTQQMRERTSEQRRQSEQLAERLSQECMEQTQRSLEGLLSIPTACALGIASTTAYAAALLERGIEAMQSTVSALRSGMEETRSELIQTRNQTRSSDEVHA